jgi:zinc/manganese transport system substrate-binding protein
MKTIYSTLIAAVLLAAAPATFAALNVVACEPEWGALAQELGGDKVTVYSATTAVQDPHHIQARPGLIARVRNADLVICTGAELEIGWLPILLRQSGNNKIQPAQPGYFEAASFVPKLEIPTTLDRAAGDVHAAGNPHIQTDPRNIARVATALAKRLAEVDPANAATYQVRYRDFDARWQAALQRWAKKGAPLKGMSVVAHHRSWPYLYQWLGLREVAELEPKPGVEPTAAHLQEVLDILQRDPARVIVRSAYEDERASNWLAQRAHIPALMLPFTVGGSDRAKDLFGLYDDTLDKLLKVLP